MSAVDFPISTISQLQAELDWVVNCENLLTADQAAELRDFVEPIEISEQDCFEFNELIQRRRFFRVGVYFESLVEFLLQRSSLVKDLRCGIQVFDEKVTVGELDFLFRHNLKGRASTKQLTHLEVASKFYLHMSDAERASRLDSDLPGPNAGDNFENKAKNMLERQILLSKRIPEPVASRVALMSGVIFYHGLNHINPRSELGANASLSQERFRAKSEYLAAQHRSGWWLYRSELAQLLDWQETTSPYLALRDLADRPQQHGDTRHGFSHLNSTDAGQKAEARIVAKRRYEIAVLEKPHWFCADPQAEFLSVMDFCQRYSQTPNISPNFFNSKQQSRPKPSANYEKHSVEMSGSDEQKALRVELIDDLQDEAWPGFVMPQSWPN